jgi:hypothetical protein
MTAPLDYAQPTPHHSRPLARRASASLCFPLVPLALLYGEWLLTWAILGHRPVPGVDEAGTIAGAGWIHGLTLFALVLSWPAPIVALVLNAAHVAVNRPTLLLILARVAAIVLSCLGLYALVRCDPGDIYVWWTLD